MQKYKLQFIVTVIVMYKLRKAITVQHGKTPSKHYHYQKDISCITQLIKFNVDKYETQGRTKLSDIHKNDADFFKKMKYFLNLLSFNDYNDHPVRLNEF